MRPALTAFGAEMEKQALRTMLSKTVQRMWGAPRTGPSGQLIPNTMRGPRLRRGAPAIQPMSAIQEQQLMAALQAQMGGLV